MMALCTMCLKLFHLGHNDICILAIQLNMFLFPGVIPDVNYIFFKTQEENVLYSKGEIKEKFLKRLNANLVASSMENRK